MVPAGEVGKISRAASSRLRRSWLRAGASHPGRDTRHSEGDDTLIIMPYEGMFSLVVAE